MLFFLNTNKNIPSDGSDNSGTNVDSEYYILLSLIIMNVLFPNPFYQTETIQNDIKLCLI